MAVNNVGHLGLHRGSVVFMDNEPYCVLEVIGDEVRLYNLERKAVLGFVNTDVIKQIQPQRVREYANSENLVVRRRLNEILPDYIKNSQILYSNKSIFDDEKMFIVATKGLNEVFTVYADLDMNLDKDTYSEVDIDALRRVPLDVL